MNKALIEWRYANDIERASPLVAVNRLALIAPLLLTGCLSNPPQQPILICSGWQRRYNLLQLTST
jgi:hypothetical protein